MSALQQNAAPVPLAERRWILIGGAVVEVAFEPRLIDLEIGEFRILGTNNLMENRRGMLTEHILLARAPALA